MTRAERVQYRILVALGVTALLAFYAWWFRPSHVGHTFGGVLHAADIAVFGALTIAVSHRTFMDVYLWVVARKIQPRRPAPVPATHWKVAFITTFVPGVEGLDLLARTLPAMVAADYPHDTWLLDEGDDPAARALAERLGVHYFTRHGVREYNLPAGPFTARTKGGNHNAWYDAHGFGYDIVAQIDTDFTPSRAFLTQTLGHFTNPRIGWVCTPQIYGNTQGFVARGASEQQHLFYGPILRGLAGRRLVNMLGANHVVRVAALKQVEFYAGHLTEDLLSGMRLHALGWQSAYVPEPLAVGEGPSTWRAYFIQQRRWAYGCIDILAHHSLELTRRMPRSWALLYLSLQQGYFGGLAGGLGVLLLCLYFFGGWQISNMSLVDLVEWGLPLFALRKVITLWMHRFDVRPRVEGGLNLYGSLIGIAVWPIYLMALIGVIRQRPLVFKVTPKGRGNHREATPLRLFTPHLVICALSAACLVIGTVTERQSPILVFWAATTLVGLSGFIISAVAGNLRPRLRRSLPADLGQLTAHPELAMAPMEARAALPGQR